MVSKLDDIFERFKTEKEKFKGVNQSLKEICLTLGYICVEAIFYNQPDIISEMRQVLELEAVDLLQSKHISTYIKRACPGHESYIHRILPPEWKDESHVREMPPCDTGVANYVMNGGFTEWMKILSPDLKHRVAQEANNAVHEKKAAKEPSISDILDVWDRIGAQSQECVGGANWVKNGKLLLHTHPEHGPEVCDMFGDVDVNVPEGVCPAAFKQIRLGYCIMGTHPDHSKHFCYMTGQETAFNTDNRNDIPQFLKEKWIKGIATRELSIREAFRTRSEELLLMSKTPKWGSILFTNLKDWAIRDGCPIPPAVSPSGEYTAEEKWVILGIIDDYYHPAFNKQMDEDPTIVN